MKLFMLLLSLVLVSACSDSGPSTKKSEDIAVSVPVSPSAVLSIGLQQPIDGLFWVSLDGSQSAGVDSTTRFEFLVFDLAFKRQVAGPGQTTFNAGAVLLAPGRYEVKLTVTNETGERDSVTESIAIDGEVPADWRIDNVKWVAGAEYSPNAPAETFRRTAGALSLGIINSLFSAQNLGASGTGCGGMLNNGGNGINVVTGAFGFGMALYAPEIKAGGAAATAARTATGLTASNSAAAGMKIAGGNKSGACLQSQIDAINDQLRFQETQIQNLYAIINRDEQAFYTALVQIEESLLQLEKQQFEDTRDKFTLAVKSFMQDAALWDEGAPWQTPSGDVLPLDLLKIAASNSDSEACTVGYFDPDSAICLGAADDSGPMVKLNGRVDSLILLSDLVSIAGLKDSSASLGDCRYDCWKHEGPASAADASSLLTLYQSYASLLFDQVALCTSRDPDIRSQCMTADSNVISLFEQYNTAISARFLQALTALQQAYYLEQLINLYNYNRYVAAQCASPDGNDLAQNATQSCSDLQQSSVPISLKKVDSLLGVPVGGTWYHYDMTNSCGGAAPSTQEEHGAAFVCAQQQLALLYAQRFNVLYTHALNFIITDLPVGEQAYPDTRVTFPPQLETLAAELQIWNRDVEGGGLGATFDYAAEVGRSLPSLMNGARTPLDLMRNVAGLQTNSGYDNWTADAVLYQAYQIADAAACIQTLLNYNGTSAPDTQLEDIYQSYDDCPSIFALHDGTGVINGFYDGITVQPYSYQVAPGGAETCPAACGACLAGVDIDNPDNVINWIPGGQGLFEDTNGVEQCRGFCSATSASCGDYLYADVGATDCTQCSATANRAVLALSAPMGGNVRQCQSAKPQEVVQCAAEGGACSCSGPVYYGKRYVNALFGGAGPGSGLEASFEQMIQDGDYSVWPTLAADNWNAESGDNGSWKDTCVDPVFSGFAGNIESPPTLSARCRDLTDRLITSQATCASARWTNSDGQLACASPSSIPRLFPRDSVDCANTTLGDPLPGYEKQCFCPSGSEMGWLRADMGDAGSNLTYLSCGNFGYFNPPKVAWEYDDQDGSQYGADDDLPPTWFRANPTQSSATKERDVGILSEGLDGYGVRYEVAFANVNLDCNAQDNIQLDIIDRDDNFMCESPVDYQQQLTAATWIKKVNTTNCLEFSAENARIVNRDNGKSVFYNMVITPRSNRLGIGSGPSIPIDLVLQCSDNGPEECVDQSMCMHMVSFNDTPDDNTPEQRAAALAKRGYVCEGVSDKRGDTRDAGAAPAIMRCELADGRSIELSLKGYKDLSRAIIDDRASIVLKLY